MPSRSQICHAAAAKWRTANPAALHTLIGFDGFLDDIIDVVDKRHSHAAYDRIDTIAAFGQKISAAANQSTNFELVTRHQKLGGNGPIMANALAILGLTTSYIGNLGDPDIHPVFHDFAKRANILSIAQPAHTNALEFLDGKLMLGDLAPLSQITWPHILDRVGKARMITLIDSADLIGMVNWTMLPHMTSLWQGLLTDILPALSQKTRRLFIDLADPLKRPVEHLQEALQTLQKINALVPVILGLNTSEALQVSTAINIPVTGDPENDARDLAIQLQKNLALHTIVIHPRKGAAAANSVHSATFAGPFVQNPKISTGAGDHFNAGFAASQLLGLSLDESLAAGCATSGYYVRTAQSPTAHQLAAFLNDLPPSQT